MLTPEEISERNGLLINFITALDLGIHIVELADKPRLLSADYTKNLSAYVKNFHLILLKGTSDEQYLDIRLKPVHNMDVDALKVQILEWMVMFDHKTIYTLVLKENGMFVTGFNHHNRVLKLNPYPVFARFNPITYYELERAENTKERFSEYNLIIK
jgi:hypothetical protein